MSDTVSILLFCLMLLVPVVLVVGLATYFSRKARGRGNVSVSDSMNDINNAL